MILTSLQRAFSLIPLLRRARGEARPLPLFIIRDVSRAVRILSCTLSSFLFEYLSTPRIPAAAVAIKYRVAQKRVFLLVFFRTLYYVHFCVPPTV